MMLKLTITKIFQPFVAPNISQRLTMGQHKQQQHMRAENMCQEFKCKKGGMGRWPTNGRRYGRSLPKRVFFQPDLNVD